MIHNKLTIGVACALGLAAAPMASQAEGQCDFIYGVHDGGKNDSQLLRYSDAGGLEALGAELKNLDIEALDISPDGTLTGAAGDDTHKPAHLYTFDMETGAVLSERATDCHELDGISFKPSDGTLWGWDQIKGLVQITDSACTTVVANENGFEVEDLTWDNAGETLYFAYNAHNNGTGLDGGKDDASVTHHIGRYSNGSVNWAVCDIAVPEIEALEVLNDDSLLVGYHENGRQLTTLINLTTCATDVGLVNQTDYTDIEGLAVCLPEAASCPSDSIVGAWRLSLKIGCGARTITGTINYSEDLTWRIAGYRNGGSWSQQGCDIEMIDVSLNPNVIWTSTLGEDGTMSGTYNGGGLSGCWTATRLLP